MPRRTVYDRPIKAAPKVQDGFAQPIKALIEQQPSFGHRTVAALLRMNKIGLYHHRRPHQALAMKTPAAVYRDFALAA